jgi:hypothetical protein
MVAGALHMNLRAAFPVTDLVHYGFAARSAGSSSETRKCVRELCAGVQAGLWFLEDTYTVGSVVLHLDQMECLDLEPLQKTLLPIAQANRMWSRR